MALTVEKIQQALEEHPRWTLKEGKLVRECTFVDFSAAIAFVNRIAELAEAANHHPDIDIRYNQVELGLISHDAGALTQRDLAMVEQIDTEFADV